MEQRKRSWLTRSDKVELFEQIRREHEFDVGTISGVSRKLGCIVDWSAKRFRAPFQPRASRKSGVCASWKVRFLSLTGF
jgi:hypothetical protein